MTPLSPDASVHEIAEWLSERAERAALGGEVSTAAVCKRLARSVYHAKSGPKEKPGRRHLVAKVRKLIADGMPRTAACKQVAAQFPDPKASLHSLTSDLLKKLSTP